MMMQVHASAAKAGVNQVVRVLAMEWGPTGVRVNGIVCGTFDTDAAAGLVNDPGLLRSIQLGRVGRPEEVVGAVVYLLSDASSYTTGSLMTIDGGVAG